MTKDLAVGLRIPEAEAEKIKQRHGCALVDMITPGEMIEMPKVGGRDPSPMPRRKLSEIIEPRAEEIFSLVKEQCEENGFVGRLSAGVVLTGGSAIMEGMTELAERVFRLPVRRGVPRFLGTTVDAANGPMYATGVGLALRELQHHYGNGVSRSREGHSWLRVRERVAEWFRDFF
jgi:cell division protein FtsA